MYLLIALLHAVPVFVVAAVTKSRAVTGFTAVLMACVGAVTGSPTYILLDVVAVGVATIVSFGIVTGPSRTESSLIAKFFTGILKVGVGSVLAFVLLFAVIFGPVIFYNRFFGDCADSKLMAMNMTFKECRAAHTKKR